MSPLCLPLNGGGLHHAHPVPDSQLMLRLLPSSTPHAGCSPPVSSSPFPVGVSPEPGQRDPGCLLCYISFHASADSFRAFTLPASHLCVGSRGALLGNPMGSRGMCGRGHGRGWCGQLLDCVSVEIFQKMGPHSDQVTTVSDQLLCLQ